MWKLRLRKGSDIKVTQKEQRSNWGGETVISQDCDSLAKNRKQGYKVKLPLFLGYEIQTKGGIASFETARRDGLHHLNRKVRHSHEAPTAMNLLGFVKKASRHLSDI